MRVASRGLLLFGSVLPLLVTGCPAPSDRLETDGGGQTDDDGRPRPDARPDDLDAGDDAPDADPGTPDAMPPAPDAMPPDAAQPLELSVCASGGGDYTTIGAAVAVATPDSTIMVCAGTYHERLDLVGIPLTLIGTAGAGATIIDGDSAGTVITIGSNPGVTLRGLTIQHGTSASAGGGLHCMGSGLELIDSVVLDNNAVGGGGLYANGCTLSIVGTRFQGNEGNMDFGGGALIVDSAGSIDDAQFLTNHAFYGGGLANFEGSVTLVGSEFRFNTCQRGCGLYHSSDAAVTSSVFSENVAGWTGGGVHVNGHAAVFSSNAISSNTSVNDGGGIYLHQGTGTLFQNHVINNTCGDDGGGIRVFEGALLLQSNLVENNRAEDSGGGIRVSHVPSTLIDNLVRNNYAGGIGGGMDLDNDASTVRGGEITGNRAGGSGGGIHGALAPWVGLVLDGILIKDNRAWQGAGIYLVDNFTPVTMRDLTFIGNKAGRGGALMVSSTTFTLRHSTFSGNTGTVNGGAIYARASKPWVDLSPATPDPCPCPPVSPVGEVGFVVMPGGVSPSGSAVWTNFAGLTIHDSILFDNAGVQIEAAPADPAVDPLTMLPPRLEYDDIYPATFTGMADPTGSDGNLSVDPPFAGAPIGDFHLMPGSACIDSGDPAFFDLDATRADMGVFGGAP